MIFYFNQTAFEAYVTVTWAAGGTCTISNGNLSYVAPNTSGNYTFTVEEEGTWTATVTRGSDTYSGNVTVNESGQNYSLTINCNKYLFRQGTGAIAQFAFSNGPNGGYSVNVNRIALWFSEYASGGVSIRTQNKIDLTGYMELHIDAKVASITGEAHGGGIGISLTAWSVNNALSVFSAYRAFAPNNINTGYVIDISNCTGGFYCGTLSEANAEIYNIYLC